MGLLCNSCLYGRILYFNSPTLSAPTYFDNRLVRASTKPLPFAKSASEAVFRLTDAEREKYGSFDGLLSASQTRAFVVSRDDVIVYERYFGAVSATTQLPAFSMSKTFAALLVGCAVEDGLLTHRRLVTYLPELASKPGYDKVTLEHLLRMTSGIEFDEESLDDPVLYYSTDLRDEMYSYDVRWAPGKRYLYGSINMQLLWDVLHRRLGGVTVSEYFQKRIWEPLGADQPASWSLDSRSSGIEKFFAGFNATARDYARLGLLFLHGGTTNGRTIVSQKWIDRSLSPDPIAGLVHTSDGTMRRGMYQWFLTRDGRSYFAKGYNGQYVFVVPERRMVFVRFGEGYGDIAWPSLFVRLAESV